MTILRRLPKLYRHCSQNLFQSSIIMSKMFNSSCKTDTMPAGSTLDASSTTTTTTTTGISWVNEDIVKSASDQRQYCGLGLNNGLHVLLISDPDTDKAAAAMDVYVGQMNDPAELPGLAHFCEHMLFLGTEKYPEENEYSRYLTEHAGSCNAYTSLEHTNYHFDVAKDDLAAVLDRFAQFFISPLFTPSATEREVNAVDSENANNLKSDPSRLFQLMRSISRPGHDFNKFGTGNKETLDVIPKQKGINVREELLKFHQTHYSSNIMALIVLGKESIESLKEMVVPLFEGIANQNVAIPEWKEHPFGPNEVKKKLFVVPIMDVRCMTVCWPIPDQRQHYKSGPTHYISHLVGHEGPGSLLSELKLRGWVNALVAGADDTGCRGFDMFSVSVDLSVEGIKHVDDVVTHIFQYLNLVRKEGPQEWIFNECRAIEKMNFRFQGKEEPLSYACSVAGLLYDYPMKDILCGILEDYKPELITDLLNVLTPENTIVTVAGQQYKDIATSTEKWYGTSYTVEDMEPALLESWRTADEHPNLRLPTNNQFLPDNFDLSIKDSSSEKFPVVLLDGPMSRLWYRQDDKFLHPKAYISLSVKCLHSSQNPLNSACMRLFLDLLQDSLTEYTYDAELAGLCYSISNTLSGFTLRLGGYSDKQLSLLTRILLKLTAFTVNPSRFALLKDNYVRELHNFKTAQPYDHASYYTDLLTLETKWTTPELLDATSELSKERLEAAVPVFLSSVYFEGLVYGNATAQYARSVKTVIEETLSEKAGTKPLPVTQRRRRREHVLPNDVSVLFSRENEVHKSNAVTMYLQCGTEEIHLNMLLELTSQILRDPCFDCLRTKQQLGYIVWSGLRRSCGVQGFSITVQSDKATHYVEQMVEEFLAGMCADLAAMTSSTYSDHIAALATRRLELPKKMASQHASYWSEISIQEYHFDRSRLEVEHLRTISKEQLIDFYKAYIKPGGEKRRKLSVHINSTQSETAEQPNEKTVTPDSDKVLVVDDVTTFKRSLALYPLPKPYVPIAT